MVTDRPPTKKSLAAEYAASDERGNLEVPKDNRLLVCARDIEAVLDSGQITAIRVACEDFVTAAADFYKVSRPPVKVLAARPLHVREGGWSSELFGDYDPETAVIRVWMRTAVRKQVTSYGTFLSTLCHEFCHHLDYALYGFKDSYHTRGFYERAAALYHHARQTPPKRLFWAPLRGGRWRIDWVRTNRGP